MIASEERYQIEVKDTGDVTNVKLHKYVSDTMWACHTIINDGYVVGGHVPFPALAKLLEERLNIAGIAVHAMPSGSSGLENDPLVKYVALAFDGDAVECEILYKTGL